ncbi:MAG: site-specific integrase [Candidatus Hinthialibacter antarcticus]|nr:site-specific integrase [Candidatus Hinthialibacter antarcticus]
MASLVKRGRIWYVDYFDAAGKRRRFSTKTDKKKIAQDVLSRFRVELSLDANQLPTKRKKITLETLKEKYLEFVSSTQAERWVYNKRLILENKIIPFFGKDTDIKRITGMKIEEYQRERLKDVSARTVNIDTHHVLLVMLNKAVDWKILPASSIPKVAKLPETEGRLRFLNQQEIQQLITTAQNQSGEIHCFVTIALNTGMRAGEIVALRWRDIDFTSKLITVAPREGWTTKTRKRRDIPMNQPLHDFLQSYQQSNPSSEMVLNLSYDALKKRFKRLIEQSGLPTTGEDKVTAHTLRHTFASNLVMKGIPLYTVAQLLGHSNTETTKLYSHLAPGHLKNAVDCLEF